MSRAIVYNVELFGDFPKDIPASTTKLRFIVTHIIFSISYVLESVVLNHMVFG